MSFQKLPTDLQNLVNDFASHPFKVGAELDLCFWQNQQFNFKGQRWCWLEVMEWARELDIMEYKYILEVYYDGWRIVSQNGNTVGIQQFTYDMVPSSVKGQNFERGTILTPVGEIFERQVEEAVEEDGKCNYWIVFREAQNSSGGGPQTDDQLRFCPEERFFIDEEPLSTTTTPLSTPGCFWRSACNKEE